MVEQHADESDWFIINDNVIECDNWKLFSLHDVPITGESIGFFGAENLEDGNQKQIWFVFNNVKYQGTIQKDKLTNDISLTFNKDLKSAVTSFYDSEEISLWEFRRIEKDVYLIFVWNSEAKMRKNSVEQYDKNLILYGPPGTGKTYNSIIYAVAICDGVSVNDLMKKDYTEILSRYNQLREKGRIVFTTFHQSYGYEEFIEGIYPVLASEGNGRTVEYKIRDGIFKNICSAARNFIYFEDKNISNKGESPRTCTVWAVKLYKGKDFSFKEESFNNGEICIPVQNKSNNSWTDDHPLASLEKGDYVLSYLDVNFS